MYLDKLWSVGQRSTNILGVVNTVIELEEQCSSSVSEGKQFDVGINGEKLLRLCLVKLQIRTKVDQFTATANSKTNKTKKSPQIVGLWPPVC